MDVKEKHDLAALCQAQSEALKECHRQRNVGLVALEAVVNVIEKEGGYLYCDNSEYVARERVILGLVKRALEKADQ